MLLVFQVMFTEAGANPVGSSSGRELIWTSPNLSPNTQITVQVFARNGFGDGEPSVSRMITTRFGGML